MHTRETRFFKSKVELRVLTPEQKAAGYIGEMRGFIPYGSDSREMRDGRGLAFVERLAPGVFTRSLADAGQTVFADVGHNDAATFARSGVNLTLEDSAAGLTWTALLPDTTVGRDLKANVALGIIDGTSFEFELRSAGGTRTGEEWAKRDALAAYLETTLAARGLAAFTEATVPPAPEISEDARETRLRLLTA
jgi:HK97 family phage prohead protease